MSRRRVAVTGATGFVGTALVQRLREGGDDVTALVRAGSDAGTVQWLARRGVRLARGDVAASGRDELAAAFDGADLLVHAAAVIGYRRRLGGRMWRTNVLGTRAVVRAALAARVGRLVHVSSVAAIGATRQPVLQDESSPWTGDDLDAAYFDTKHRAELEVAAGIERGLCATIVNPGAVYGPAIVAGNSSRLLAAIAAGRVRFVPPGGVCVVPLSTVLDGILSAAARGRVGARVVLGAENLHVSELVTRVARAAGRSVRPRVLPAAAGALLRPALDLLEPLVPERAFYTPDMCALFGRYMWFDTRRMREELLVQPDDLDACLAAAVQSLRRHGRA